MYVNSNGNNQDGVNTEVQNRMNQDRYATCIHVAELDHPSPCRKLEQQPWREEDEHHHRHHHRSPIRTHLYSVSYVGIWL
ncbi:hypothetical protein F511_18233 [Dorcoceras hygrometricum]|uniref:Uncharacterized protein n=1 Tax=Dorcoceras hygrometricum TaxID=472368 RepID=A0A2Z7AED1_9LAMI|nr:hypothetical protein F511_18233 [Dorcoceras hygrometricum]